MKKLIALFLLLVGVVAAQDFPAIPIPAGVAGFVEYNQLGSPKIVGGVSALYPVSGAYKLYMTTTALLSPQLKLDPTTNKQFYAVTTSFRQGLHRDMIDVGKWSFLVGGDLGPALGSNPSASSLAVNFSSSVVITPVYQLSKSVSLILPLRGVYINNVGWNPEVDFGVQLNLSVLTNKATAAAKAKAALRR